jgi:excisionase family DNA binding protein
MGRYLTTGQAASILSVTPDTVLKWIRSGILPARRTAGGHHRIEESDLQRITAQAMSEEQPAKPAKRRQFRYCWEFHGKGQLLDRCKECSAFQMRAHRCYEVARLAPETGPPKMFCKVSCEDCEYYQIVHEQITNVLVITDNPKLTGTLKENAGGAPFNLEFADCEYTCSALVTRFRPDFAVIDCSLGSEASRDITNHLAQDPRVPYVRVVLAGNDEEFPEECDQEVFARIERPFSIQDIRECIDGIAKDRRDNE